MKTTVNLNDFRDWFQTSKNYCGTFSWDGLEALFNYLEEYEQDCGEELDFDPVAIACEYTEYKDLKEFWNNFEKSDYPTLEEIQDSTTVIKIEGTEGFIIQDF